MSFDFGIFISEQPKAGVTRFKPDEWGLDLNEGQLAMMANTKRGLAGDFSLESVDAYLAQCIMEGKAFVEKKWKVLADHEVFPITPQGLNLYLKVYHTVARAYGDQRAIVYLIVHHEHGVSEEVFSEELFWAEPPFWIVEVHDTLHAINQQQSEVVLRLLSGRLFTSMRTVLQEQADHDQETESEEEETTD